MKASQARDDHFATLVDDARLSGVQRQVLRHLVKLQKAALRLRVMALPLAHKAGHVVRAGDALENGHARGRQRRGSHF
jgi:hypothetical protein